MKKRLKMDNLHGIKKQPVKTSIKINENQFVGENGCTYIFRGVNLAGISIPFGTNNITHIKKNWPPSDLKNVSWINRPFPLDEADEHFIRLRVYGFNILR
ncbi:MAG: hypothetical protein GF364_22030, partial [Candidatus Lokiarchaeota archaeon]|nr:hypothetical protein [Candidatus Lokiarchaeota archaeon]